MTNGRKQSAAAAAFVAILAYPVAASAADEVVPKAVADVLLCRRIEAGPTRLACLDAAAAALSEAVAARSIVVLDRSEIKKTRRSLFGFTLPRLPFFGNDRDSPEPEDEAQAVRQIETTIRQVGEYGRGMWTLVLEEGGTWRTTETSRTFDPKPGDPLTIKRGTLGNYLAVFGRTGSVRVERVR